MNPPTQRRCKTTPGALTLISAILFSGCAHLNSGDFVLDVPFHPQAPRECGVAVLRMIFDFYAITYDPVDLRQRVFLPALAGTFTGLVVEEARRHGLNATAKSIDTDALLTAVARGNPVIVLLAPPPGDREKAGHLAVVTGISADEQFIFLHGSRRNHRVALNAIEPRWSAAGHTAILVTPPGTAGGIDDTNP